MVGGEVRIMVCELARSNDVATPWSTGAGAVGHMRIRWTVEAHVAENREMPT